ncbi:MAG: penicillin acylase family protein [Thermoleophilaceae bacterium]
MRAALSAVTAAVCAVAAIPASAAAPPVAPPGDATITRTEHSIPNIQADDMNGAGYGVGYAQAEDNICLLAEMWVTLEGRRSLHFGPNGANSDLYNTYINQTAPLERMLNADPPHGPGPEAFALLDGYVAGYNAYLEHVGVENIPDQRCAGKPWVRPIERIDVIRRVYELIGYGGRDLVRAGMVAAQPPGLTSVPQLPNELPLFGRIPVVSDVVDLLQDSLDEALPPAAASASVDPTKVAELAAAFSERANTRGSNAVGLGSEATHNGSGMLLANPHWTWDGFDRFWQMHVDVPGEMHTSGMGFIGQPLVMIGHNEHVAWSHTVSAARRFALMELTLVPGEPTKYVVDGEVHDMEETEVSVQVREEDGSVTERTHTFYSTIYGPIATSVLGIELLPWTHATAYALVDLNEDNARIVNQFIESNSAGSAEELYDVHARYSGNPWATTTVADDQGNALWTDVGTVPNVSNEHALRCNTPLGHALWNTLGAAVLRGAQSSCAVPDDPEAAAPKVMAADKQPVIRRHDYVENSNESHWLTNAHEPLEGFSRVFGPERSARAMRTRLGHKIILEREGVFTRQGLQDALFNNRHHLGELWADDLVTLCRATGRMPSSSGELVDVSEACDVIDEWDRTDNLDSPGAVLFKRFADLSLAGTDFLVSYAGISTHPMWKVPFDVNDPVNTPRGLNPAWAPAHAALADAVKQLGEAGIPLDATLRDHQISNYGGSPVPVHGGSGELGLFNVMSTRWNGQGYSAGGSGPSFVMVTSFGEGCPDDRSLLLGSQRSQHSGWGRSGEQVELYSRKEWVDPPFCADELAAAQAESVTQLGPDGVESVTTP